MAVTEASIRKQREHEFDALVKIAFRNERINFLHSIFQEMKRKSNFSEFSEEQLNKMPEMSISGEYDKVINRIPILGVTVEIEDVLLLEALKTLDEIRGNIIIMAFWLEMNDREIAEAIGYEQRNVNQYRHSAYKKLKKFMEKCGYESKS